MDKDIASANINDSMKRQLELLRKSPTFFNILGLTPTEVTWTIDLESMEKYVKETAERYLGNEVRMATIDPTSRTREPMCHIWLKADSKHLVDSSRGNGSNDQVFAPKVSRFSDELKRFADQFAPTENPDGTPISRKKLIKIKKNDRNLDQSIVAIPISLTRMLKRIFDVENRAFIDTYGSNGSLGRCNLKCSLKYTKKHNGDSVLSAIRVTKRLDDDSLRRRPRPIGSFRDSDRDDD